MEIKSIFLKDQEGTWQEHKCIPLTSELFSRYKTNAVSMIDAASWQTALNSTQKGFCHNRFQPNLVITYYQGDNPIKSGQKLGIADVRLFVMEKRHMCHKNCPLLKAEGSFCQWTASIHYAVIQKPGSVCVNDTVMTDPVD